MSEERGMNPAALMAFLKGDYENAEVATTPGGIEEQERRGQEALTRANCLLPKTVLYSTWEAIEAMGFKRGAEENDLFYRVEFPEGWSIRPTEHTMWSHVVDAEGKIRLRVFYKAAFYDRVAHIFVEK